MSTDRQQDFSEILDDAEKRRGAGAEVYAVSRNPLARNCEKQRFVHMLRSGCASGRRIADPELFEPQDMYFGEEFVGCEKCFGPGTIPKARSEAAMKWDQKVLHTRSGFVRALADFLA